MRPWHARSTSLNPRLEIGMSNGVTTSEPARLALYNRLGELLGHDLAETLMSSLPARSADDLATKTDINRLDDHIERLDARIDDLAAEMRSGFSDIHQALNRQLIAVIGAMTALTGIFSVVVGLIT